MGDLRDRFEMRHHESGVAKVAANSRQSKARRFNLKKEVLRCLGLASNHLTEHFSE